MVDIASWIASNLIKTAVGVIILIGLLFLLKERTSMKTGKAEKKAAKLSGILLIVLGLGGIATSIMLIIGMIVSGGVNILATGFFAIIVIFFAIFLYTGMQILRSAKKLEKV